MPNPTIGELLQQGLIITVLGITLVFAGLGLLWGLMEVLMRVLPPEAEASQAEEPAPAVEAAEIALTAEPDLAAALTAERARVAAIVASMALAHALPGQAMTVPPELVVSGDGRGESWTNTYRARSLHSWQPPRVTAK